MEITEAELVILEDTLYSLDLFDDPDDPRLKGLRDDLRGMIKNIRDRAQQAIDDDPVAKGKPYPGMEWDHPDQKDV